jgi:hypothetical protein
MLCMINLHYQDTHPQQAVHHTYGTNKVSTAYLASVNTAFAFFSLSPSHLFSIVEASTVRKVAPPWGRKEGRGTGDRIRSGQSRVG